MPPAIDDEYGNLPALPTLSLQSAPDGLVSTRERTPQQHSSGFVPITILPGMSHQHSLSITQQSTSGFVPITHLPGMSHQPSLSIRTPSSMNLQSAEFYGTHAQGRPTHVPAEIIHKPAMGLQPPNNLPVYRSLGTSSQRIANPLLPPQMHATSRFQAHGSAQTDSGGSSHSFPKDLAQRNNLETVRNLPYVSPYYREPEEPISREYSLAPYYSDAEEQRNNTYTQPQGYYRAPASVQIPQYDFVQFQPPRPSMMQSLPSSSEPSLYPSTSPSPAPSPSRRGRPPGKKVVQPSKLAIEIHVNSPLKPRGRPRKNLGDFTPRNSPLPPSGSNSAKKKRGRPFKSAESAAKAIAKAKGEHVPGKRGRPMKARELDAGIPVPMAEYISFVCEWKGCEALLHNLETLKRHVMVVHGKKGGDGEYVCSWGKCAEEIPDPEDFAVDVETPKPVYKRTVFTSRKERHEHLEKAHFVPFSWHIGDGPKATCLERKTKAIDPWLLDKDGNQVTPSIENQVEEGGIAKYKNKARWVYEMKKRNIKIKKGTTNSSFMKTPAQLAQEENAESEPPSRSGSGSREVETGNEEAEGDLSIGDDNENEKNDEMNDVEMDGAGNEEAEGDMSTGDDNDENENEPNAETDDVEMEGVEMEKLQPSIEEDD